MPIVHATPNIEDPRFMSLVYPLIVPYTVATAGPITLTAAQVLGGLILRDTAGAARVDTMPTAAQLVAAIPGALVGTSFEFYVRNTAAGAFASTITVSTGGTLNGAGTSGVAQSNTKQFLVVITNITAGSEAYTLYSLGGSTT